MTKLAGLLVIACLTSTVTGFVAPRDCATLHSQSTRELGNGKRQFVNDMPRAPLVSSQLSVSTSVDGGEHTPAPPKQGKKTLKELRAEGGPFTFNTPIGALNPFAIYYGIMSLILGLPWYIALKSCQLFYFITRGRFDVLRRAPVFFTHLWGVTLMRLSRGYPEMENYEILEKFYKEGRPAMFVANHCSWMDIPFIGVMVGWRNYKLISKKELGIVPILGAAIRIGGNIMVDRSNRRSQFMTLKQGINYLKDGVHLCTFPEGTRSRTGRVMKFKNGAFKMAHKAGAPVVPISIVDSHKVMPTGWMFAMKPSYKNAKLIINEPIESVDKTEEELAAAVRESLVKSLPDYQQPEAKDA